MSSRTRSLRFPAPPGNQSGNQPHRPVVFGADTELLSLDVFGVALDRLVLEPDDVHRLVGSGPELAPQGLAEAYPDLRREAELRAVALARIHGRAIIGLADIGDELLTLLDQEQPGVRATVRRAISAEIELERQLSRPHPQATALVAEARRRRLPVAFLSDTYLPRDLVAELLRAAGLAADLVLVSSHEGSTMASGQLFRLLAARSGIAPNHIAHVGPLPMALDTDWPADLDLRWHQGTGSSPGRADMMLGLSPPTALDSVALAHAGRRLHTAADPGGPWTATDIGYYGGGPLAVGFASWIDALIRDQHPDLVLFTGPTGALVHGLVRLLRPDLPAALLQVTRPATTNPASGSWDPGAPNRILPPEAERLLVVDLGWNGQTHQWLERQLTATRPRLRVSGAYLGITERPGRRDAATSWAFGPGADDPFGRLARPHLGLVQALLGAGQAVTPAASPLGLAWWGESAGAERQETEVARGIEQFARDLVPWIRRGGSPLSTAMAEPALRIAVRALPAELMILSGQDPVPPASADEIAPPTSRARAAVTGLLRRRDTAKVRPPDDLSSRSAG